MAQSFFPVSPILVDLRCLSRVVTSKEEMMPNKEVAHSKVLIVGGSSGMGLALARRCLDSGARVVIAGRSEAKLRNASPTLRPHGVPDTIAVDVTQEEHVERLFSQVGQLDHIVSTAADIEGAYQLLPSLELDAAQRSWRGRALRVADVSLHQSLAERPVDRRLAMNHGSIEDRCGYVVLTKEHSNFRATEDDAVGASMHQVEGNLFKERRAVRSRNVPAELLVDYSMDLGSVSIAWNDGTKARRLQALNVESLLHGERCRNQAWDLETCFRDSIGCRVSDVQHRNADPTHHLFGHLVHCVCGQNDKVGTAALQSLGLYIENSASLLPLTVGPQRLDPCKIQ